MFEVRKTKKFDAAHYLPEHGGKCKRLHGHTWKVTVCCQAPRLNEAGMVVDFARVSLAMNHAIETLDHSLINDSIANPTAENIARWVWSRVSIMAAECVWVEVQESAGNVARYYADCISV
jgi:6-pyruvoyltetrahydropterin/6-carboxytetrahydropterin synthase